MKEIYTKLLCCPECKGDLKAENSVLEKNEIKSAILVCGLCSNQYKINEYIPIFYALKEK